MQLTPHIAIASMTGTAQTKEIKNGCLIFFLLGEIEFTWTQS